MSLGASSSMNLAPFSSIMRAPSPLRASVSRNVGFPGALRAVG